MRPRSTGHTVENQEGEHTQRPLYYEVNGVPVRFFRTYVGAADICHALGLLDRGAVDRVCERALVESSVYDDSRRTDIERDVERWRRKT